MKLVRDKIPQVIARNGGTAKFRIAREDELPNLLIEKFKEESMELSVALIDNNDDAIEEEMADLLEVMGAIADMYEFEEGQIENTRAVKAQERGRFKDGIILVD